MHLLIYVARERWADEAAAKLAVSGAERLALENQLHASNPPRSFRNRSNTRAGSEQKEPTAKAVAFVIFPW